MSIVLTDHAAAELAEQISMLQDWLAHTEFARDDLAEFAFRHQPRPLLAVEELIDYLDDYSLWLRKPPDDDGSWLTGPPVTAGPDHNLTAEAVTDLLGCCQRLLDHADEGGECR